MVYTLLVVLTVNVGLQCHTGAHTHMMLNLTIHYLCLLKVQENAGSHSSAATEVLFTPVSAIALIHAHNFKAYTTWIACDDQPVTYENYPFDELYTTAPSDLYKQYCNKNCT